MLSGGVGKQWDPQVVTALLQVLPDIDRIRNSYQRPPQPCREAGQWDAVENVANVAGNEMSGSRAAAEV